MKVWMRDPLSGGVKIPKDVQERTGKRIEEYAAKNYAGRYTRLDIRFKGVFCYIDAYQEPDEPAKSLLKITGETREEYLRRLSETPTHLCRLRYFGDVDEKWSLAFYTYSNEKYEPCIFANGSFYGTPEEGFDIGAIYLHEK
ncbi:MAG: hypothetical protein QME64_06120 [bacterium]|nr:hypothetical protein [bacterium]